MSLETLIKEVFQTDVGKLLLDELTKQFLIKMPTAPHSQSESYAYFREGQNSLIRQFIILTTGENNGSRTSTTNN